MSRFSRRKEVWRQVLHDTKSEQGLASKRMALLETWRHDPWAFFSALDADGQPVVWTVDELDDKKPKKPFPAHKEYLSEIVKELSAYRIVLIDKIRQKYITNLCALMVMHYCMFTDEREVFISRLEERSAVKLINDKIRKPHAMLPKWLQEACPISKEPKNIITFGETGSTVTGVSQNFGVADARGSTASLVLVDEAAYQDFYPEIHRAILPMAARLWAVSTANTGNPGAELFASQVHEGRPGMAGDEAAPESMDPALQSAARLARNHTVYRTGLEAFTSPSGNRVVILRLGADPEDTPEWIAKARLPYANEKDWRREMMGDWTSPAGDPFFPIFSHIGRDKYVHYARRLITAPVFVGLDFGKRRPAAVWMQYAPRSDRIFGYREWMPHDIQCHEFRDGIKYLCGLMAWEEIPERSQWWIEEYMRRSSGFHCPPPWFPPDTEFIFIGGKEALQGSDAAVNSAESTRQQIFAAGGITLHIVNTKVETRNDVVGRMLMMAPDGWPRTFLDPQMNETIVGFDGAFSHPKSTKAVGLPEKPKNDNHYINLLDAWGYAAVAICPKDTPDKPGEARVIGVEADGRTPIMSRPDREEIGWYENRRSLR